MAVEVLSYDTFEDVIDKHQIVFIDFWANWCAPCKVFATVFEKVAIMHPDIKFVSVDIEHEDKLATEFSIQSVPHLLVMKEGIAVYSDAGAIPEKTLSELVEQAREADVSRIKENIRED